MKVAQLIELLSPYPGDMKVVAIAMGDREHHQRVRITGVRIDQPDGDAAFAIVLDMVEPPAVVEGFDPPHYDPGGYVQRNDASHYTRPRNVALDQGYGGVERLQRQAEADIKREASSPRGTDKGCDRCGALIMPACVCHVLGKQRIEP